MGRKDVNKMTHEELIEEINVLGPWSHGFFDLGNGLIIEDQDLNQKKRLFFNKDYFIDIIRNYYQKETLSNKTLCDIGCNAGYFLYELYKRFKFRQVVGLEPRKSNLAKAKFIAEYFELPINKYRLRKFDILTKSNNLPCYDIVIMPGVLQHIDNHLHALSNVYKMTRQLCIIEAFVLPNALNTADIAQKMVFTDDIYKRTKKEFGIIGYKMETNKLDGSAYHTGIVGLPTEDALKMMLHHVGFSEVKVYRNSEQLKKEVYNEKLHREMNFAIITASKETNNRKAIPDYNNILGDVQKEEFNNYVPMDIIRPLYEFINGDCSEDKLPRIARLIYESELYFYDKRGERASKRLTEKIGSTKYYSIIKTFKHAPQHKIMFESAKACYHKGLLEEAEDIAEKLIKIVNLDWRTVYKTYYLLAIINFKKRNKIKAVKYNRLSLRAFDSYLPALDLKRKLGYPQ